MVLAAFEPFQKWRHAKRGWRERKQFKALTLQELEALAQVLRDEGATMWMANPHQIVEAIVKVEQSWALRRNPDTAVQLGVMYDLVNRHQDALSVYCEAFHLFPEHPRLRHEASIKLLRHGQPDDIRAFFESVLRFDPEDVFAQFVSQMIKEYPSWVEALTTAMTAPHEKRDVYTLACAVWGEPFTTHFVRDLCAALLSPNNLPAFAKHHSIHFAIFTTAEIETRLRNDPIFIQLSSYAAIHFILYDPKWLQYKETMKHHYGTDLGLYYSRTCKFLLFSCAHYASLAAGRRIDSNVVPLCAGSTLSDGALPAMSDVMAKNIDVIAFCGFNLTEKTARPVIEQNFRDQTGSLSIPPQAFAKLFADHMPEQYFVDSPNFSSFPINLCWRVGPNALLVHATHYHAICIRPAALALPFELTIDPVDSRFLDRRIFDKDRIHFVQDLSITAFNLDGGAEADAKTEQPGRMSVPAVGRWLWQVWGPWRASAFGSQIAIVDGPLPAGWHEMRKQAQDTADQISRVAEDLEEGNRRRKHWKLGPIKRPALL